MEQVSRSHKEGTNYVRVRRIFTRNKNFRSFGVSEVKAAIGHGCSGISLEQPAGGTLTLYGDLRSQRDLYYQHEWETLAQRHPNFSVIITLSRPEASWKGSIGRVTTLVENNIASVSNVSFFLCGHGGMIRDATAIVTEKSLCPICTEQYYDQPGSGTDH